MADLQNAIAIAGLHAGQVDKGDRPYILHPLRVMMSLRTTEEMIVGVLHDVVEDCASLGYGWDRLRAEGFSERILGALASVTKTAEEDTVTLSGDERTAAYLRFVARAKANIMGARVAGGPLGQPQRHPNWNLNSQGHGEVEPVQDGARLPR